MRTARPVSVRSCRGAEARLCSAVQTASLTSGVTRTSSLRQQPVDPLQREGDLARLVDARERLKRQRAFEAELDARSAHGQRGRARGAAPVEQDDLGTDEAAELQGQAGRAARTCPRRSGRRPGCGRHRRHAGRAGTACCPASPPYISGGASRCGLASGPAHTADTGIRWARFRVCTMGWRTLA